MYNKIFFNLGSAARANGIGDLITKCSEAGIPVYLASTDDMVGLFDLQEAAIAYNVPHVGNWRSTGYVTPDGRRLTFSQAGQTPGAVHLEVPDHNVSPVEAAEKLWPLHRQLIPKELNPDITYISTVNEVRGYVGWGEEGSADWATPIPGYTGWADWMGHFALRTAELALADGFKFAPFGFASGNPEEGAWEQPYMLELLRFCAKHPDKISIALHEYSFDLDDIWDGDGRKVGRFEDLFETCDHYNIPRPKVQFREWGWTLNRVPDPPKALEDIRSVMRLYAQYPQIQGAALWSLIGGWQGLGDMAQKLIAPISDLTLSERYAEPTPAPPPTPPPVPVTPPPPTQSTAVRGKPREDYQRTVLLLPPTAKEEWAVAAALALFKNGRPRISILGSADDAAIGDLSKRHIIALNPQEWGAGDDGKGLRGFYETYYGLGESDGVTYEEIVVGDPNELVEVLDKRFGDSPTEPPTQDQFRFEAWPTEHRVINQGFGKNPDWYAKYGLPGHEGVDVRAPHGSAIYAVADGTVIEVGDDRKKKTEGGHNYGVRVYLQHRDGWVTIYAHLDSRLVNKGDSVKAGQTIGRADNTGNSSGSHLHLTLKRNGFTYKGPGGQPWPYTIHDPSPFLEPFLDSAAPDPSPAPTRYHGVATSFKAGLHAPGSDYMWQWPQIRSMFDRLNMPVKFLSNGISKDYYTAYSQDALVRIFWQPDRKKSPEEAWTDVRDGVLGMYAKGARTFEVLNENNLPSEGAGMVWANGDEFGRWLAAFVGILRAYLPHSKLYYPGMSPGVPWTNQFAWTNPAWIHVRHLFDGICMHAYTGNTSSVETAAGEIVSQVAEFQKYIALDRPLIVSELSVNRADPNKSDSETAVFKARVYRAVEEQLRVMPGVEGVFYFISHWLPPQAQSDHLESWLDIGLADAYLSQP